VSKPLADRLDYSILDIVMRSSNRSRQDHWGGWEHEVRQKLTDRFQPADLKSAFKRLWNDGILRLSRPDSVRRHAFDYSGNEADDPAFFDTDRFNATITDKGIQYRDRLRANQRDGVFIGHITEEKPLALVLQKYLRLAFGEGYRVFVSSDAKSIGGGKKWYTHIIENLGNSGFVVGKHFRPTACDNAGDARS